MGIVVPTVDSFKDTTVMKSVRKVVDYLINTLIPNINTNITAVDSKAQNALTVANTAQSTAEDAQATADANTTLINNVITQFNIMVDYIGSDAELVTNPAPQKIETTRTKRL